jgi:uncharacterized repeat protein (TIGR03803 family)
MASVIVVTVVSAATTERVIYSFPEGSDPLGARLVYLSGRFYGTIPSGGNTACTNGCGSVFELAPQSGGGWNFSTLYSFTGGSDGGGPTGKLVLDKSGNLYGAAAVGGANQYGAVFKLTPTSSGPWTETTIHSFVPGTSDGAQPASGLTIDASGNLYGSTPFGGVHGIGAVYQLSPNADGSWSESLLYSFNVKPDGQQPDAEVTFDASGNLYGTTYYGGRDNIGTVYELSPASGGGWTEKVIFDFDPLNGRSPQGPVSLDSAGNVYGTTSLGGENGVGTVFELTPNSDGSWSFLLIHEFGPNDGRIPNGELTPGVPGVFYGATSSGGTDDQGIVYGVQLGSNGQWTERVIYSFDHLKDGFWPQSGVLFGPGKALFGVAGTGGATGAGAIFELTP